MVLYFALNLLCAYVSCIKLRELPSDPLESTRIIHRQSKDLDLNFNVNVNQIVNTTNGQLEGYVMSTIKNRKIHAFEGIPFGESTGGVNRFLSPIPSKPWRGVRQAKKIGDFCVQWHLVHLHIFGNEDCLFLNIYTPKLPVEGQPHPNLPVIIFVHGGSFFFGSGSEYGPSYLLENDVILVTVNYRLGILGFLSTGDSILPGNNGLKDQALAIKWTYENIAAFGGDQSRITLMGQSSGAASIHLHMISKVSRPYFSAAISLSGTAFNPWSISNKKFTENALQRVRKLTKCDYQNSKLLVQCLRKINPYRLMAYFTQIHPAPAIPVVPLGPVIEPPGPDAFLTKHPDQAYAERDVAKIPWISTTTEDEGHFPLLILQGFRLDWSFPLLWPSVASKILYLQYSTENVTEVENQINDFYFKSYKNSKDLCSRAGDLFTDRFFSYATHKSLQLHSLIAPTYSYVFGYRGRYGVAELLGQNPDEFGVGHIDDLPFIFNMTRFFQGYKTTDREYAVVKLMTSLMANFAKIREPLYTDETGISLKIWDKVSDPKNIHVLQITEDVKMIPEKNRARLKFWENVTLSDINPFLRF